MHGFHMHCLVGWVFMVSAFDFSFYGLRILGLSRIP
jgi:hypothetical protein